MDAIYRLAIRMVSIEHLLPLPASSSSMKDIEPNFHLLDVPTPISSTTSFFKLFFISG